LNRTHFYASSRVPLSFDRMLLRFAIYIAPLLLFAYQIQTVLRAMRCQTSPGWSEMQYGASDMRLDTDFAGEGGYLSQASSALLFWETTEDSCKAAKMLPINPESTRPSGSLAILWPLFSSIMFSQFVETLSCALQGRHPVQEAGMTIFEHSLAYAEAEAVVTKPLIMDNIRFMKPKTVFTPDGSSLLMPRSALSKVANVPPEVLLISLISSISHFTSNALAIAGVRSRYRLITTTIWGLAYMATFSWSFVRLTTSIADPSQLSVGILRFPTVCIVGFLPHLLVLVGVLACLLIYVLALCITVLSPPPGQPQSMTLRERFTVAYNNLHANIHLSAITPLTISWHEDFYTAILKVGFTVLTAASEAVFLNEGTKVNVHPMTWLEKQRLQDIVARRRRFRQSLTNIPSALQGDTLAEGNEVVDGSNSDHSSQTATPGYARERKSRGAKGVTEAARAAGQNDPAGLAQRRSRFFLTYQFFRSIAKLLAAIHARLTISLLMRLRITYQPRWLRRLAGPRDTDKSSAIFTSSHQTQPQSATEPWLTLDNRNRMRPDGNFDVETFAKERLRRSGFYAEPDSVESEERLNDYLYSWWRNGGRWGEVDTSSDYMPPQDDDTTSVVSFASTTDNEEWSDEEDGQRTPTRETYRETTPSADNTIDLARLSHLLDPKTKEDREEARLLARHLESSNMLTRSQYRKVLERNEAKILATSRYNLGDAVKMTPEEEEQLFEDFILTRRTAVPPTGQTAAGNWDTGAEGMGSEGPQCVVCQVSPRTVLVWPCGCLSLCDDCRVGLASKNYTACVCCRTNVVAYSRLYVP
jgi:hypothetical protein